MKMKMLSVVAFGVISLLVGCSGGDSQPAESTVDSQVIISQDDRALVANYPTGRSWRNLHDWARPFDYFSIRYDFWQAETVSCMSDLGFDIEPGQYSDGVDLEIVEHNLNRTVASQYGYHLPDTTPSDRVISEEETVALEEECAGSAWESSFGLPAVEAYDTARQAVLDAIDGTIEQFFETEKYREVVQGWSECMAERGYHYSDPKEPIDEFLAFDSVQDGEVETRLAAIDCDEQVGLTSSQSAHLLSEVNREIDKNSAAIAELEALRSAAMKAIVGAGGASPK